MTAREFPAITLWQPWASLIFTPERDKLHETRAFRLPANRVGPWVAIHSARRACAIDAHDLGRLCRRRFGAFWWGALPRGRVLGLVRFGPCVRTEETVTTREDQISGDWRAGRFAWPILEAVALDEPLAIVGRQGWWRVALEPPAQLGEATSPTQGSLI